MKKLVCFLCGALLCALPLLSVAEAPEAPADPGNSRVFYEIFPGSFSDSDGDGLGDLKGLLNRLDYLNDGDSASGESLGVQGLWLTPVFSSPSYHKYDITDYYTIDPAFGTTEDLQAVIEGCHARGMKLILDLPLNHTSSSHRWFRMFRMSRQMGNDLNEFYDYYICVTEEEKFPGHTYAPIAGTDLFYECNFSTSMPELNFDNEAVRQEALSIARHWLSLGVDGFRFDAAKYIYFNDHPASAAFWQWYTDELRSLKPEVYLVAEVWDGDGVVSAYTPMMSCFNFTVSQAEGLLASAARGGDVNRYTAYVDQYMTDLSERGCLGLYTPFISNHDMDRAAGYLTVSSGQIRMAANLYLLGPGTPFLYYGEEIGLKGSRGSASSDANRRLAMRWGDGDTVRDPREATYDASKQTEATVESMKADPDSLLRYYSQVIALRTAHPEIALGTCQALSLQDTKLGGFIFRWKDTSLLVLHNTTKEPLTLDLASAGAGEFTEICAAPGLGTASLSGTVLTLEGQTSVLLK